MEKRKLMRQNNLFIIIIIIVASYTFAGCNKESKNGSEPSNSIPACTIESPKNGEEIKEGEIVTINVDAKDTDGYISEVILNIDNMDIGSSDSIPFNFKWNTTDQSIGNHTIKATAKDNDSGVDSDEVSVSIIENDGSCPGLPTITYEGQLYHTVQIGNQCWMKENLNVGTMINSSETTSNNDTIEKYCYDNNPANCDTYGGLYYWREVMKYTTEEGTQGICPQGWHVPTDNEWKILEGTVDSLYPVGDIEWLGQGWRGFDVGINLKSKSGWYSNGNGTDKYGFLSMPSGYLQSGEFSNIGKRTIYLTSSLYCVSTYFIWDRDLSFGVDWVGRGSLEIGYRGSVRCLKDN